MGFYAERIVPRIVDAACGARTARPLRRRVCAGLAGEVVEIGFGSGHNVPFYPPGVTGVAAIEPSDLGWELATDRVRASRVPVRRAAPDARSLPFEDGTFDAALSTWTLCTVPDPLVALCELRRVLKPGGALHFVEHGLAPEEDRRVRRRQRRIEPLHKRLSGGCHLTRPTVALLTAAGFMVTELDVFYQERVPKPFAAQSLGIALSPGPGGPGLSR
ncbi:class I SAM-dependent methyltransferase [Streptomyces sp. NPDC090021]|uniref:class I SAM-dependent methyltransferase n=1 Tax=Streptomyces sp. NPDC090021 TaxID=3365919 RepID=UPI0038207005